MITIQGFLTAFCYVRHPIFDAKIRRELALNYVRSVSPGIQDLMNQERLKLFLSLEEEYPLTKEDQAKMDDTIEKMKDR